MRERKRRKRSETPETIFRNKLIQEHGKNPGMMVKAERMAQGRMADYGVRYIHASQLDPGQLERNLKALWGGGSCLMRFVDSTRQPLDEFGALWIHLMDYDDLDDRLEEAQFAANVATLKIITEMNNNSRDAEMANLTVMVELAGKLRRNNADSGMIDALRRSMQRARPDSTESINEIMKLISEMQNQQHQQIMKQQADAAKQFLDSMPPEVQAALKAQGIECQTPAEPAGRQFPPGNCSPPIVGLQRLKISGEDNQ